MPAPWASMRSTARWVLPVLVGPRTAVTFRCGGIRGNLRVRLGAQGTGGQGEIGVVMQGCRNGGLGNHMLWKGDEKGGFWCVLGAGLGGGLLIESTSNFFLRVRGEEREGGQGGLHERVERGRGRRAPSCDIWL